LVENASASTSAMPWREVQHDLSPEEYERIQRAAEAAGEPVAAWVREQALTAAGR